jgi:cyclic pyranopterin phosphate synthase
MIEIYTDGACKGNPGTGGWAAIIVEDGSKRALHGKHERTTNNRMEMLAVLKGLEAVPASSQVTVFSDSQYVVNTMTRNWKRNVNRDLWDRLDAEASKRDVSWRWVRGHDGNPLNEEADGWASREAGSAGSGGPPGSVSPRHGSLSHLDESGKARMVDVGGKPDTERLAVAGGSVVMTPETLALIKSNSLEKGDVLGVARVAGIMAAKNTPQLIPLCHPLPLNQVTVEFELDDDGGVVNIEATAKTTAKTGVEMEAMTAVSVAALTIYDMCKAVDRAMRIERVRLIRKTGGKSGEWEGE